MFVTYLFHSYLLGPHNVQCLYAFETGIADTELSTYIACYVAAKATYIRLLHGKIGISEGFFGPSSVHRGRTHIVLG